jgi:hypothetical protein
LHQALAIRKKLLVNWRGIWPLPQPLPCLGEGSLAPPSVKKRLRPLPSPKSRGERVGWEGGWGVRFSEFANSILEIAAI